MMSRFTTFHKSLLSFLCISFVCMAAVAQKTLVYDLNAEYYRALDLFDKEKYSAAQEVFRRIERQLPADLNEKLAESDVRILKTNVEYYEAICAYELFNNNTEFLLTKFINNYPDIPKADYARFYVAKYHYRANRFKRARLFMDRVDESMLTTAEKIEYWFKKGYCSFNEDKLDLALIMFQKVIDQPSSKYTFPAIYYTAYCQYEQGKYQEALTNFAKLSESKTYATVIPFYIADIHYRTGNYEEAIKVGTEALQTPGGVKNEPSINKLLANCYYKKEVFDNALFHYKSFAEDSAKHMSTQDRYQMGYCYYKTADIANASATFEKLAEQSDIFGQFSLYTLADCFLKKGDKEAAKNSFWKASKLNHDAAIKEESLLNYAKLCYELDFHLVAISSVRRFINEYPQSRYINEAKELLTEVLLTTKNYKEALEVSQSIPNRSPKVQKAYQRVAYFRGVELYNQDEKQAAFDLFKSASESTIDMRINSLAHYWMADIYYDRKNWDEAINHYKEFLSNPASRETEVIEDANYAIAYAYFRKENYVESAYYFDKYIKLVGENTKLGRDSRLRLGDCFFVLKDYEKAVNNYNSIITNNYKGVEYALLQKGIILGLINQQANKVTVLRELLEKYPSSTYADDAQYELAMANMILYNWDQAKAAFTNLVTYYPQSSFLPSAFINLGLIAYNQEKDEEALAQYKQVILRFPNSDEAVEALAAIKNIYVEKGNAADFLAYSKTVPIANFTQAEQDTISYRSANYRYNRSDCLGAINGYDDYLNKFPEGIFAADARYQRADCLVKSKQEDKAIEDLAAIVSNEKNKFTEKALYNLSKLLMGKKRTPEAIQYLRMLEQDADYKAYYGYALAGLMKAYFVLDSLDKMDNYAKQVLAYEKASSDDINNAHLLIGKKLLYDKDSLHALEQFATVIKNTKTLPAAEALYLRAQIQLNRKMYSEAQTSVFTLIHDIPSFEYWIGKAYILLADTYVGLGNNFQAKSTLQSIIENYKGQDEVVPEARGKLIHLLDLEKPEPVILDEEENEEIKIEVPGLED